MAPIMAPSLILFCLALGFFLRRSEVLKANSHEVLNTIVIGLCLPALTMLNLRTLEFSATLLLPVLAAWLLFGLSFFLFLTVGRCLRWSSGTIGALVLTGGLANTSFVGFSLIEGWFGQEGLATALLVDQLGTFMILSTCGVLSAGYFSGQAPHLGNALKGLLRFPPFVSLLVTLVVIRALPLTPVFWAEFDEFLKRLSSPLVPLALISVGTQLSFDRASLGSAWVSNRGPLVLGLAAKLVFIPAVIALTLHFLGMQGPAYRVTVLEVAMAPMITGAILASKRGLNPALANLMVGVGIPLSLITTSLWYLFLGICSWAIAS